MQTFKEFFSNQTVSVFPNFYKELQMLINQSKIQQDARGNISISSSDFTRISSTLPNDSILKFIKDNSFNHKTVNDILVKNRVYIPQMNGNVNIYVNVLQKLASKKPGQGAISQWNQSPEDDTRELEYIEKNARSKFINQINAPSHGGIQLTPSAGGY